MKHIFLAICGLTICATLYAQPSQLILHQEDGRITFAVDEVDRPENMCGTHRAGTDIARSLNRNIDNDLFSDWEPEIVANSFAGVDNLYDIGEDIVFQMLLKAWCQHRPVVLSPDAVWLIICQQFSHYVNEHPEEFRSLLVNHEGKKELKVETALPLDQAEWPGLVAGFTSEIAKYTNNDIATTLVADFSTTGTDERIASEVTLMDVVKPYFDYTVIYAVCGIPSITLTGTPADWRKVLEKTQALEAFGLGWWTSELEPLLEEFVKAAEGHPDYWFWKDIVKKSRPRTIQGPSCTKRHVQLTKFDGWFLKFFPFDNKGRTPKEVDITQAMLPETVAVPFKYQVTGADGAILSETTLELVAGIIGVEEDAESFTMTPKIGWFVRTARPAEEEEPAAQEMPADPYGENILSGQQTIQRQNITRESPAVFPDGRFNGLKRYPKGFGIGMHLGAGSEFYTGPLASFVTPVAGIDFGFDLAFSRVNLYLNGLIGWGGRYKQDILRDGYKWEAGKRISGGNLEVSAGYTVYDSPRWRIAPFAGIGVGFIDYPYHPANPKKNSDEISGFRFQAGISADYKFYRLVEYLPEMDGLSEFSVKTRLYVARTAFPTPAPAWTINIGISANMLAWMLKQ